MSLVYDIINLNKRGSLENPQTSLADADDWLVDWAGGGKSDSGVLVNEKNIKNLPDVWRAINLLSNDFAKLPLIIYRRQGEGKKPDTNHPAYQLLKYEPNSFMTAFTFKQTMLHYALLKGNSYAYIFRNGSGKPKELMLLRPDTYPVLENGILWYVTTIKNSKHKLKSHNVLHLKGLGDGIIGESVIANGKQSFGHSLAANKFGAKFFANGAGYGVVIQVPDILKPEARKNLAESWNKIHQGIDNAHKTAVLEQGAVIKERTMTNKDAQFLETRKFQKKDIANWFGTPAHKLGDDAKTSYNSIEQENRAYLDQALDPWLTSYELECKRKLCTEPQKQRDTHVIEFLRNALLRADTSTRYEAYAKAFNNGWMTANEIRSKENMNPYSGGDKYLVPVNLVPADKINKSLYRLLRTTAERMNRRLDVQRDKAEHKQELAKWLQDGIESNREIITQAFSDIVIALSSKYSGEELAEKFIEEFRKGTKNIPDLIVKEIKDAIT